MQSFKNKFYTVFALMALSAVFAHADIKLTLEHKDSATVSDIVKVVAHAESTDGIDKVEFKLDDLEAIIDTSTPYEFDWDTIKDTEGKHTLAVTAFDSNGKTKRITITLIADNELGIGGTALGNKARMAFDAKKPDEASRYCRRAIKAETGNLEASRVLAMLAVASGNWTGAISALEGAKGLDGDSAALREMAAYRVHKALLPETGSKLFAELQEVDTYRRKAADLDLKVRMVTVGEKRNPEESRVFGDALLNAGHYAEATREYARYGLLEDAAPDIAARLGLAYSLDNHTSEAITFLMQRIAGKNANAALRAVLGMALLRNREFERALKVVSPDISAQLPATLIIASNANAVFGNYTESVALAKDAVGLAPQVGESHFALAIAFKTLKDSDPELNKAVALSAFQPAPFLELATRVALDKRPDRYDTALNLTDIVLKYDPKNMQAQLLQSAVYLQQSKFTEAEGVLNPLMRTNGGDADVLLTAGSYWYMKENSGQIDRYLKAAMKVEPVLFKLDRGLNPLELLQFLQRKIHYRSGFYLSLGSLFKSD